MSVTSIARPRPDTIPQLVDACEAAIAIHNAIQGDLAVLVVECLRRAREARPVLRPLALLDVAQADKFLIELDEHTHGADLPRAMYLLGQSEGHLQDLSDIIHASTGLPR